MKGAAMTILWGTENVLIPVFLILASFLIVRELLDMFRFRAVRRRRGELAKKSGRQLLADLEQTSSSYEKARIFVALILVGYVLNHTIGNEGEKYDDGKQHARFKRFLTPAAVGKLNSMDGKTV